MATNIDDIVVLSLFFARGAGRKGTAPAILAGQYLGFLGILAAWRILVVVETLPMFRLSLSVRPFSRLVFESPGFCGGGG